MTHVLIMAGGTGGHIYPALAVADELMSRGATVSWLGTQRGLEARVVPEAGIEIDWITVYGLRGNGLIGWISAPIRLSKAVLQAWRVFSQRKPNVVLGMGGFVTGPGGLVSWLRKKPLLVHEQNAIPGLTNRLLAPLAKYVMTGFANCQFNNKRVVNTGNPIRQDFSQIPSPSERLGGRSGPLKIFVVGGSLGASVLNEMVPKALQRFAPNDRPEVWHQAGPKNIEQAKAAYASAEVSAQVVPYIENVAEAYSWADLVICRAGALTVAELAAVGVASILVPYAYAVDDHQTANARYLSDSNAAFLVSQKDLNPTDLFESIHSLQNNRQQLLEMAIAARQLARPNATTAVADLCLEAAHV